MTTESLPQAVKNSPKSNHKFATYLIKLGQSMTGNANYATPNPTGAALTAAGEGLAAANATAKNGGTAAVAARDAKRKDAEHLVDQLVAYVQVKCPRANAGDAATANAMIASAGLSVHKRTKLRTRPQLAAKWGLLTGEGHPRSRSRFAVDRHAASYMWDFSVGPEGLDERAPRTDEGQGDDDLRASTPGQVYYFRFHAQTRKQRSARTPRS